VLLSEDHGDLHSGSCPPDLWQVVRLGEIEVSDDSDQERLDLHDATQRAILSVPGKTKQMKDDQLTRTASPHSS